MITAPGVHDTLSGHGDSVSFASGMARPLTVELAQRARGARGHRVVGDARGSRGLRDTETAALSAGGTLNLSHGGGPTTVSFTLSDVRAGWRGRQFCLRPDPRRRDARLTVKPGAGLRSVKVTMHDRGGRTHTVTLRNRATAPAKLTSAAHG